MNRAALVLATLMGLAFAAGANAAPASSGRKAAPPASNPFDKLGVFGAQYRYWSFTNGNDLRDPLVYWSPGWFHVQLEYWDFLETNASDQFRPEIGLHYRDQRRSVYTVQWRHEHNQERYWFGTDQVLTDRWVGRVSFSPITTDDPATEALNGGSPAWVIEGGADYYWGSYNFASATVVRDPRAGGLWVVPMRVRLANEANDWLQATLAPASERTLGWAVDGKYRWLRVGVERNSRYDFTTSDNVIFTAGIELNLDAMRAARR